MLLLLLGVGVLGAGGVGVGRVGGGRVAVGLLCAGARCDKIRGVYGRQNTRAWLIHVVMHHMVQPCAAHRKPARVTCEETRMLALLPPPDKRHVAHQRHFVRRGGGGVTRLLRHRVYDVLQTRVCFTMPPYVRWGRDMSALAQDVVGGPTSWPQLWL